MDQNKTGNPKRSWAKIIAFAFLIYLVSFGIFVVLDNTGVLPRPCPVLYQIYYPLIWLYLTILFGPR
jgi:hypothetical protein